MKLHADLQDAHSREVASLRNALTASENRCNQLEMKVNRLTELKEESLESGRIRETKLVEESAMLRAQVRVLESERDRFDSQLNAAKREVNEARSEASLMRQKFDVLRSQYSDLDRKYTYSEAKTQEMGMPHLVATIHSKDLDIANLKGVISDLERRFQLSNEACDMQEKSKELLSNQLKQVLSVLTQILPQSQIPPVQLELN